MQVSSRNVPDTYSLTQCVCLKISIKRLMTRVVFIWMLSHILKSSISWTVKMLHRMLLMRSTVLAGNEELFQSRQLKSATVIRGRLQMARLGLPCLFLSIARSPSCVLARTRVCFLPTVLDKCTWRPIRATLVLYGGICRSNLMATPVVLFKMVMDVSHARLRQGVFADGLAGCWRAVAVLNWVGRKERYQVLFSVLDFFVQPNLELQQP